MNAAPTLNFEKDVGKRTTFRVIGHRNVPRMLSKEEHKEIFLSYATTRSESVVVLWLYSVNLKRVREIKTMASLAKVYKNVTFFTTSKKAMDRNMNLFYEELGVPR